MVAVLTLAALPGWAENPTDIAIARSAAQKNMKTSEGQAYYRQLRDQFSDKYRQTKARCSTNREVTQLVNFDVYIRLQQNGSVDEVLLSPKSKVASCIREKLVKDRFTPPPQPRYWVHLDMRAGK
jgi:hypothetical protein